MHSADVLLWGKNGVHKKKNHLTKHEAAFLDRRDADRRVVWSSSGLPGNNRPTSPKKADGQ